MLALRIITVTIAAVGLIVNAVIHFMLAGPYDAITGTLVGQGDLFRIQAVVNLLLAALLLISLLVRRVAFAAAVTAVVVAAGGLGLVIITTLVPLDLTSLGLPYLFEPVWYADKINSAIAQGVALVAAGIVTALEFRRTGAFQR